MRELVPACPPGASCSTTRVFKPSDAPYNSSSTYYHAQLILNDFISDIPPFYFDDGSHETYDVKWPDVLLGDAGGIEYIKYSALSPSTGCAGILYEGLFPDGNKPGKIITLGFPFETIYGEDIRNMFIDQVLGFFNNTTRINFSSSNQLPDHFRLDQNYPNPFNPTTTINYSIPAVETGHSPSLQLVKLVVYNVQGRVVVILVNEHKSPGNYSVQFDGSSLSSGIYFYTMQAGNPSMGLPALPTGQAGGNQSSKQGFSDSKKMMLLK